MLRSTCQLMGTIYNQTVTIFTAVSDHTWSTLVTRNSGLLTDYGYNHTFGSHTLVGRADPAFTITLPEVLADLHHLDITIVSRDDRAIRSFRPSPTPSRYLPTFSPIFYFELY